MCLCVCTTACLQRHTFPGLRAQLSPCVLFSQAGSLLFLPLHFILPSLLACDPPAILCLCPPSSKFWGYRCMFPTPILYMGPRYWTQALRHTRQTLLPTYSPLWSSTNMFKFCFSSGDYPIFRDYCYHYCCQFAVLEILQWIFLYVHLLFFCAEQL